MHLSQIRPLRLMEVEHLTQVIQLVRAELGFRQQPAGAKAREVYSTASSK